jgi:Trk-type K+ transport system membrane component
MLPRAPSDSHNLENLQETLDTGMKRFQHLAMIAHDMGLIFIFLGIVSFVPFLVLAAFGEWDLFLPMLAAPVVFLALGILLSHIPHEELEPSFSVTLGAVALSWLAIAFIGAIPFVLGLQMSYTDSIFEAMSGWTGTGFSMIASPDATPKTLLFWRSFMHWVGGIGILAFSLTLGRKTRVSLFRMYKSEGREEELVPTTAASGRRMWMIYLVLTFAFTGLVMLAGIPLWDGGLYAPCRGDRVLRQLASRTPPHPGDDHGRHPVQVLLPDPSREDPKHGAGLDCPDLPPHRSCRIAPCLA